MITLEDFQLALDEIGAKWRISGQSMAMKYCPACGSSKYKVIFRKEPDEEEGIFFGKCLKGDCLEGFSSVKYLTMSGMDRTTAIAKHGKDPDANLRQLHEMDKRAVLIPDLLTEASVIIKETDFMAIEYMPDHFVAKYAIKRGYTKDHSYRIMMDLSDNSVVFLIRDGDDIVGTQKRFVSPNANPKVKTSHGFKRSVLMEFKRGGRPVVVCEGPFTALSAWHYGFHGVASLGAAITGSQIDQIKAYAASGREILFALEGDEASSDALRRFQIIMEWEEIAFKIIVPETGKDLNDSWQLGKGYYIKDSSDLNLWLPKIDMF